MPDFSALTLSLLIAAIIGGLLHLLRQNFVPAAAFAAGTRRADDLRLCLKPPGASPAAAPHASSATPFPPRAKGELILLVDDEASVRNLLTTVLLNHGYEVITARDGAEGVTVFRENRDRVALVITDIFMPKSNGRNFVDLIRPLRPDIRVLFMSGLEANGSGRDPGRKTSQDPFLLKPFKPASLLNTIHQVLYPDSAKA
ncbi:MAG: two-component system, cell cycle sensor histidine kinase and response regulator CckA [Verrucomicrobiota bacterium]|nr:two-component system, cell cycle sensor histidine kinase and response regulator CckA [Verrucomicrobiota bacterium]